MDLYKTVIEKMRKQLAQRGADRRLIRFWRIWYRQEYLRIKYGRLILSILRMRKSQRKLLPVNLVYSNNTYSFVMTEKQA